MYMFYVHTEVLVSLSSIKIDCSNNKLLFTLQHHLFLFLYRTWRYLKLYQTFSICCFECSCIRMTIATPFAKYQFLFYFQRIYNDILYLIYYFCYLIKTEIYIQLIYGIELSQYMYLLYQMWLMTWKYVYRTEKRAFVFLSVHSFITERFFYVRKLSS
jgi:hypothetical protein